MTTRVVHVRDNLPDAIYIGRAVPRRGMDGSIWANPYPIGYPDTPERRSEVISQYRAWLMDSPGLLRVLPTLRGKPLACWCRHDYEERTPANACHGDILVWLLEQYSDDELRAMGGR